MKPKPYFVFPGEGYQQVLREFNIIRPAISEMLSRSKRDLRA